MRLVRILLLALLTTLLMSGCAGAGIEVRGFTPRVTNAIVGFHDGVTKIVCRNGVRQNVRQGQIVLNQPDPYYTYPATPRTEAHVVSVTECNP